MVSIRNSSHNHNISIHRQTRNTNHIATNRDSIRITINSRSKTSSTIQSNSTRTRTTISETNRANNNTRSRFTNSVTSDRLINYNIIVRNIHRYFYIINTCIKYVTYIKTISTSNKCSIISLITDFNGIITSNISINYNSTFSRISNSSSLTRYNNTSCKYLVIINYTSINRIIIVT